MIPPMKSKAKVGIIEMLRRQGMPGGPMNMGEDSKPEETYIEDLSEEELAALSPEERKKLKRRDMTSSEPIL